MAQINHLSSGLHVVNGGAKTILYDANGNPITKADLAQVGASDQGVPILGVNDKAYRTLRMDRTGGIGSTINQPMLHEPVEGTTIHPQRWTAAVSGFAQAQTASGINITNTAVTTANAYSLLKSARQFTKMQRSPIHARARMRWAAVANSQVEIGFGDPGTNVAIANGAMWVKTAAGAMIPQLIFNSTVAAAGTDVIGLLNTSNFYTYDIIADDDSATFIIQDSSTGLIISEQTLAVPLAQTRMWNVTHLPAFVRVFNAATIPASAPTVILTDFYVTQLDANFNNSPGEMFAGNQLGIGALPTTGVQSAQWTNSAAEAAATLSNTAASYAFLHGRFNFVAIAGAVTDYALFGLAVPAPYTLKVKGIYIDTTNRGAAVAGTPTTLEWAVATQSTAISLATASYIRRSLGQQSFLVGAAIGAQATPINRTFDTPIVCDGGKFFAIVLRMPLGTATASQTLNGLVDIDGWFE